MQSTSFRHASRGLTLRTKMVLLSAAAFAGILFITVVSMLMINENRIGGTAYRKIMNYGDARENIILLKSDLVEITSELQSYMLDPDVRSGRKSALTLRELSTTIDNHFNSSQKSLATTERSVILKGARSEWDSCKKSLLTEVAPAMLRGDVARTINLASGDLIQRLGTLNKNVAQIEEKLHSDVHEVEVRVSGGLKSRMVITGTFCVLAIVLIAAFSMYITASVTRPLNACVEFARTIAEGKLDKRLEISDGGEAGALALAMNTMAENLHNMVSSIGSTSVVLTSIDNNIEKTSRQVVSSSRLLKESVSETTRAVNHISSSIQEVSDGVDKLSASTSETSSSILEMAASVEEVALNAEKLGESVEEVSSSIFEMASSIKEIGTGIVNLLDASSTTASSIAEMDATIRQVEKNAMDTSAISDEVRTDAETGKKAVEEAIAGMQEIRRSSHITAEVIENLSLRAIDIGAILSVIDEVAEQTNLLALNAAIIAAQAGEHGKGFAVVADEIRELAERTSSSTREIAAVIKGVQDETTRAVEAINHAEQSITDGEVLSQRSGAALEKIVSGVQRASIQVREIARAAVEQARGSQSIREAMESVEDMVNHIATSAREHSFGSDMIAANVERMKELTSHVRTSTREQSRASSLIARSTEDITIMIEQIRDACQAQGQNCTMISKAVDTIQLTSASNTEAVTVMEGAVTGLSKQIDLLKKEMAGFKV